LAGGLGFDPITYMWQKLFSKMPYCKVLVEITKRII